MKRVLVVVEQFTVGGLETHIRGELVQLHRHGCEVHLLAGTPFQQTLLPDCVSSVTGGVPMGVGCSATAMVEAVDRIREVIRSRGIDVVHAHPFVSLVPAMVAAQAEGISLAVSLHGPASLGAYAGPVYDFMIKTIVLPQASLVVVVSDEVAEIARPHVADASLLVVPNGVEFSARTSGAAQDVERDPRWLVVGRLDAAKIVGVLDFVRKARRAGMAGVRIAGDGDAKAMLQQRLFDEGLADGVEFLGARADIPQLMQSSAGVVGMGRVVLEGLAAQRPVVLVGYDGVKGVVDAGLLQLARRANFSGRNLDTVEADHLGAQLAALGETDLAAVVATAAEGFGEGSVWRQFLDRAEKLQPLQPSILLELYQSLQRDPLQEDSLFFHSEAIVGRMEVLACSSRYFSARVYAALQVCRQTLASQGEVVMLSQRLETAYADKALVDQQLMHLTAIVDEKYQAVERMQQQVLAMERKLSEALRNLDAAYQTIEARDAKIGEFPHKVALVDQQVLQFTAVIDEKHQTIGQMQQQVSFMEHELSEAHQSLDAAHQTIEARDAKIDELLHSTSWKVTRPLRAAKRALRALTDPAARYTLLKSVYWRLPESLRHRLQKQRARYVAAHWDAGRQAEPVAGTQAVEPLALPEWVAAARSADKVAVIPCGFEFDELVNQRPINAAKYFASRGYFVLFVAWQWGRKDELAKGCSSVWPRVHQVPLFEFVDLHGLLPPKQADALYLLTMPARELVNCVPGLRGKGYAIVYDVMDEWQEFFKSGQAPWYDRQVEEQLVLQSDVVCCVAPALVEKFSGIRDDILLIGNGYSEAVMGREHRGIAQAWGAAQHVVGYFGHLTDAWFDWKLVFDLAARHDDVRFEIIGYGEPQWVRDQARSLDNLVLVGKVHPSELNTHVRHWSVGIIPFVEGSLSRAVDPIKIYEYIYFGLPVFVTGIEHLQIYPGVVWAARDEAQARFASFLARKSADAGQVESFLAETTWNARFDGLVRYLRQHKSMGDLYGL